MNEKIKKTRKIRTHIQITSRKMEGLIHELDQYDIDALNGIQKKLDNAKNMLQLAKKPDEVIRQLQDNGIVIALIKQSQKQSQYQKRLNTNFLIIWASWK